jgi:membrane protein DedA with SNARE-associated domain
MVSVLSSDLVLVLVSALMGMIIGAWVMYVLKDASGGARSSDNKLMRGQREPARRDGLRHDPSFR